MSERLDIVISRLINHIQHTTIATNQSLENMFVCFSIILTFAKSQIKEGSTIMNVLEMLHVDLEKVKPEVGALIGLTENYLANHLFSPVDADDVMKHLDELKSIIQEREKMFQSQKYKTEELPPLEEEDEYELDTNEPTTFVVKNSLV